MLDWWAMNFLFLQEGTHNNDKIWITRSNVIYEQVQQKRGLKKRTGIQKDTQPFSISSVRGFEIAILLYCSVTKLTIKMQGHCTKGHNMSEIYRNIDNFWTNSNVRGFVSFRSKAIATGLCSRLKGFSLPYWGFLIICLYLTETMIGCCLFTTMKCHIMPISISQTHR